MGRCPGKSLRLLVSTHPAFCTWHFHSPGIFCSAWATRCPRFSTHQTKKSATKDAPEPSPGLQGCAAHGQPLVPRARLHRSPGTHRYRGKSSSPSQIQAGKPPVLLLPLPSTGFLPKMEIFNCSPKGQATARCLQSAHATGELRRGKEPGNKSIYPRQSSPEV